MKTKRLLFAALLLFGASLASYAQTLQVNPITTAVPFLTNTPDARGASLGFSGVATSPDAFSMFYNPAKYAFMSNDHTMIASGFNAFTTFPDQYMLYDAFAQRIGNSVIAATARYHRCGDVVLYDAFHQNLGSYRPQEFAVDVAYSYRFGDYLSAGVAGRFIHYALNTSMPGYSAKSSSVAGDVSVYYKRPLGSLVDMSLGASITNIGTKMSYSSAEGYKDFIPTTLRLGSGFKFNFHPKNTLAVNLEFSKLMVPTSPIVVRDGYGNPVYNDDGSYQILYGMDNNVSVFRGMFQSFYDAPGYTMNYATGDYERIGSFYEELCEVNTGIGIEYNLADHFFVRTGYYHMPYLKGGVDCLTEGLGMKFGIFGMDLSYSWYYNTGVVLNSQFEKSRLRWDMYFAF
ncbi:MAG: type IX secretion system outer membrane channel protein PorV [Bacteroidales bacterium]|nr:type IX secretion system outer membrane channel protein PorV [Bacteroidales bacterium]